MNRIGIACLLMVAAQSTAWARGASPYLPLNLSPEIERQIERVLILADRPVLSRPIAAATVLDALPQACKVDRELCRRVRTYLNRYMRTVTLDQAGVEVSASDGATVPLPNQRGLTSDSSWLVSAQGHWQINDYAILSLGGVAHGDEAVASGSMLSLGFEYAQLDVGFREHWLSPFTTSSMLLSTEAKTMPSVTLSNYMPITRLGLQYEVFLAEMSHSDRIVYQDGFTQGNPRLAGLRVAIEPVPGWSLAANRVLQFGGGARGGTSFGDFFDALFKPSQYDNVDSASRSQFGNQVASFTSRFIFPGSTPFSVYFEYAGEDTSYSTNYRLGNSALSIGISFPRLWQRFDLTYEASEWQNAWYAHGVYHDGLANHGRVIGHWGADQRRFNDAVGAQSHLVRVGWEPSFGGLLQLRARTLANEDYSGVDYRRAYDLTVDYSWPIRGFTVGAEIMSGRDVYGESFSRIAGYARFGDDWAGGSSAAGLDAIARPRGADLFIDAGVNLTDVQVRLGDGSPTTTTGIQTGVHVGLGARRAVSEHSDLGVRLEIDQIDDELLLAVRALDYRYRFNNPLAVGVFAGAARYNLATPAYGYYVGAGVQWRDVLPRFDINLDLRYADKVARDKLLPSDPVVNPRPDVFYDMSGATLSLSYRY